MYLFSEISLTGNLPERGEMSEDDYKRQVLACALMDWGGVMAGRNAVIPEKFGDGMAKVADLLGVSATPDNLMKLAEKMQ